MLAPYIAFASLPGSHFFKLVQYSPQVQVFEFLKAADLGGQFLNLVIEEVKHLQVLQFCYIWGHGYGNRDTAREFKCKGC